MPSVRQLALALEWLEPLQVCEVKLAEGLQTLASRLTVSHSLTSRRYAVWPLVRRTVDGPFKAYVKRFLDIEAMPTFQKTPPSCWGRGPPPPGYDNEQVNIQNKNIRRHPIEQQEVDWQTANLEKWGKFLLCVMDSLNQESLATDFQPLHDSLASVEQMVRALTLFRPLRGSHPQFDGLLPDKMSRPQLLTYCALCWRLSMRAEKMQQASQPVALTAGIRRLSDRYCDEHNPSDPRSRYWTDRLHREAFERELAVLLLDPELPVQEARKLAYARAHVRRSAPKTSDLPDKVRMLMVQGLTQAEIARQLGVSRQAVWKVIQTMQGD